jgi:DNA-binding CsgD family transcriptional regulator
VATQVVGREVESRAVEEFLASVSAGPCALLVEGAAGIGKTTVWLAGLERAPQLGFRVLSTRSAPAESVLAFSSLATLLDGVDESVIAELPPPQRLAIDRVLLRVSADGPVTDQRAVAAAFRSVVERLAEDSPVLLAIDDLQWLDLPTAQVVSSVARRLSGPVGVLATVRTDAESDPTRTLKLREPSRLRRIPVSPLSLGALHGVLLERLGRSFPRPKMLQIHEVSGGNPFYALELARAMEDESASTATALPGTLADLVRSRIGRLTTEARRVLLAGACVPDPSLGLIGRALNTDPTHVAAVLKEAENQGIVEIADERINFTHPLLVRGVYGDATPAQRRAMHRRLAEVVAEPELHARHLALAATHRDTATLESLDAAAETARIRGAPGAAAELVDLAIGLGGDTPQRRILSAAHHFNAGDAAQARVKLRYIIEQQAPGPFRAQAWNLLGVMSQLGDSLLDGADYLERALAEAADDLELRVKILVSLAWVQIRLGRLGASASNIENAVAGAERLGRSQLLSQALGMRVVVYMLLGKGLDDRSLRRALDLDDHHAATSAVLRPTFQRAMVSAWIGQHDSAHDQFATVRRSCIDRGDESELIFVSFHSVLNEIWRGDFDEAAVIAEDAVERAQQLDGALQLSAALAARAIVAAYAGRENDARRDVSEAIGPVSRSGSQLLTASTVTVLGFLEVSLGNYQAAINALEQPLRKVMEAQEATEIWVAPFLPDAIEAMIHLGRLGDADHLIQLLANNGRRLDRAWMLATAGRCHALLLAAEGDVDAASDAAQRAMAEHARLPMPFERARTQLVLGQIQRRQRKREAASGTLREALAAFESLGTPLWVQRAREDLQRASGVRKRAELTASEARVAELAATGATNREMAAALFISQKTVEANLSRIYRKLDIRSRAELGRRMGRAAPA